MYTEFDYRDEQTRLEEKQATFFGEFSSEIRSRLLSKNLVKPESIYDIFYPSIKNELLAKNVKVLNTDLDEFSETIRNMQLSKVIPKIFSLEEQSEDFRDSMTHRNNLQESAADLIDVALEKRKDLLSKNVSVNSDLLERSYTFRNDNTAHNRIDVSAELIESKSQEQYRQENVSKLVKKESDLEAGSSTFREDDLSKNSTIVANLEENAVVYRNQNISHNVLRQVDLEKTASQYRNEDLAKNVSKESDIELGSATIRNENISKNVSKDSDLVEDSNQFRKDEISKNKTNLSNSPDLEVYSASFRKENLASNIPISKDLEKISEPYRNEDLAHNSPKETNLETDSVVFRDGDVALNKSKETNLETDSAGFRNGDLALNVSKGTNLETDSAGFRNDDLAQNPSKATNLETDSAGFRDDDIALNTPSERSIEADSVPHRSDDLALNVPTETDIETDSVPHRNGDMALNVSMSTDLETDSAPFRADDLSHNTPTTTDLEADSVLYRDGDLASNVPITTDLETDSVSYRDGDLANNVPIDTDIEMDSVPYRVDDLAHNVPITTDLETDSVPYRDGDLASNVPITTDLETDSIPYRDGDLANNVPSTTDLETDSVLYRDDDLAYNISITTNLLDDSGAYRDGDLSANVDMGYGIDKHIDMYGNLSNATVEKQDDVSKNVKSSMSVDGFYDEYGNKTTANATREHNLEKNSGSGMLGFNVMAFGTSQYVGVSGVWAQGLLFRNLSLLRNKPGGFFYSGEDTNIDKFTSIATGTKTTANATREKNLNRAYSPIFDYSPDFKYEKRLRDDSLKVPSKTAIYNEGRLPMTSIDEINSKLSMESFEKHIVRGAEITSPIERNLTAAFDGAHDSVFLMQSMFGIDGKDLGGSVGKERTIDYALNNGLEFSSKLKEPDILLGKAFFSKNVNSLIRNFLKSTSFYSLGDTGDLELTLRQSSEISNIASQIASLQNEATPGFETIRDLVTFYKMFDVNRLNRLMNHRNSVTAPGQNYLSGDAEKGFDTNFGSESNTSIAFKKYLGNPTDDDGFSVTRTKGVKNVIKRISEDSTIEFAQNYKDIQGADSSFRGENAVPKIFLIGKKTDGSAKEARQKFTIKNPYAPEGAGKLIFYLKNYAIPADKGSLMYFPPYIQSFQNSDSASWNPITFLGRPEAVYTYNNSSRSGSITFFVLTDFAERVTIGRYQTGGMGKIVKEFSQSFLGTIDTGTLAGKMAEAQIIEKIEKIKEISAVRAQGNSSSQESVQTEANSSSGTTLNEQKEKTASSNNTDNTYDEQATEQKNLYEQRGMLEKALYELEAASAKNFSEVGIGGGNVYNLGNNNRENNGGEIISVAGATEDRIDAMIQDLAFQPAYFSGSLVDFKQKMEFLSKLTRPARNDRFPQSSTVGFDRKDITEGFSFTTPPVCHIRLGDWYDHDIIIDSVSYDYADAPWTIGGSKIQPMWVSVSINFNIVGPAGIEGGVPLTASDQEGYYGTRAKI